MGSARSDSSIGPTCLCLLQLRRGRNAQWVRTSYEEPPVFPQSLTLLLVHPEELWGDSTVTTLKMGPPALCCPPSVPKAHSTMACPQGSRNDSGP